LPITETTVLRGKELAEGFGACGFCHSSLGKPGQPLSGGRTFVDLYGEVPGPNITIADSGIGSWTEDNVRVLFRDNVRPDGEVLHSPLHKGFEWISDRDLTAVIAYLRMQPPAESSVERRGVSFFERYTTGFFRSKSGVTGYVPSLNPSFKTEYGQYLVDSIARCARCHSSSDTLFTDEDYMGGGREIEIDGHVKISPNISSSKTAGIGTWSEEDVKSYLLTGRTPQGKEIDPAFCPIEFYRQAPPSDIEAVVRYIRSIPAVE
jgi:mono/diheme cytochrome c family protein